MTRWYHPGEKWGTFVDVKKNAIECIKREAPRKKRGVILISSVTDAYQPVEKKTELTRGLLKVLKDYDFPVDILTKNSLVQRDLDVLSEFTQSEVGLTIISMDDRVRRVFEPGASPIQDRLDSLELFSDNGIPTYAFLGPLLPFISDEEIENLLNNLADKVSRVIVDRLNIKAGNWRSIEASLIASYPEILPRFKEASKDQSQYYDDLKTRVKRLLDERAIPYDIVY